MMNSIQYIIDKKGAITSVIVPYAQWEKVNSDYNKLKKKLEVLKSVKESLIEIKSAKINNIELQSLSDFLNKHK